MENQEMLNLLNEPSHSKFVTRKWNSVNDEPNKNHVVGTEIIRNIEVLKSNLFDYNNAYIFVRVDVIIVRDKETLVALKSCAPFITCIPKLIKQQ